LHCAPGQIEPDLGRRARLHTGVKAQTTVRASDRDAGGSEMATVFQDPSTIGEPAGVPSLFRTGLPTMQSTRFGAENDTKGTGGHKTLFLSWPPASADPLGTKVPPGGASAWRPGRGAFG
jgi:hypothetical protein